MIKLTRNTCIFFVILSGICFGSLGVVGKFFYQRGFTAGELVALRFLCAAVFMFVFHAFRGLNRLVISWSDFLRCFFLGAFAYAAFAWCFFSSLGGLSASLAVLLLYSYPILVTIGSVLFLGQHVPMRKLLAIPLVSVGILGLVWGDISFEKSTSLILGFSSAVLYSSYILISDRFLKKIPADVAVFYVQLSAALTLSCVFLHSPERVVTIFKHGWDLVLLISLVGTVFAMLLFLFGLQKLKSWEVALLSTSDPIAGVCFASLFLGEKLGFYQRIGAAILLVGIVLVAFPSRRQLPHLKN